MLFNKLKCSYERVNSESFLRQIKGHVSQMCPKMTDFRALYIFADVKNSFKYAEGAAKGTKLR